MPTFSMKKGFIRNNYRSAVTTVKLNKGNWISVVYLVIGNLIICTSQWIYMTIVVLGGYDSVDNCICP